MLPRPLKFFVLCVILLSVAFCYFAAEAIAQTGQRSITLKAGTLEANKFVVHGRARDTNTKIGTKNINPIRLDGHHDNGIATGVDYKQVVIPNAATQPDASWWPDLKTFFDSGGTLELLTTKPSLTKYDIVISELMWATDIGILGTITPTTNDEENVSGPNQIQWIELYNTTSKNITFDGTGDLILLFTPFKNYPNRERVTYENTNYTVLDAVSNLHLGKWNLPGRSGRRVHRAQAAFVSGVFAAYRDIDYTDVEDPTKNRDNQLMGIPFGSYADSWKMPPEQGRKDTLSEVDYYNATTPGPFAILYVATPGAKHVLTSDIFVARITKTSVFSNRVIINEIRNDTSSDNLDWIELKNVSSIPVELDNWELSLVDQVNRDTDLVDLPDYAIQRGEILLILNRPPSDTPLADGINIQQLAESRLKQGARHKYFLVPSLSIPNTGKFLLLLRSQTDKNGKDEAIEDYAGNGFFTDPSGEFNTEFWPRKGQRRPTDVADFGNNTFASVNNTWARIQHLQDKGHHKESWRLTGSQGGIGYDPRADLSRAPGTPGYENDALKTRIRNNNSRSQLSHQFTDGQISFSEIMYEQGEKGNQVQWIELYNSSLTQAVNLQGWELDIRNFKDEQELWVNDSFLFNEAIILPNQTLLLVSFMGPNNVVDNRVYNLYEQHQRELLLDRRRSTLLSPNAFFLKLTDKGDPRISTDDRVVDEAGNLQVEGFTQKKLWDLPERAPGVRCSLLRQYGRPLRPNQGGFDGMPDTPSLGTRLDGWYVAKGARLSAVFYGNQEDVGTPGHRLGSPLPVVLSRLRAESLKTGAVRVNWVTESELDTAGFNVLRREDRNGAFTVINPILIPGAGTSSERHHYTFTDTTARQHVIYYYRIEDVSLTGDRETLATVRLRGHVSAGSKLTTQWGHLKKTE